MPSLKASSQILYHFWNKRKSKRICKEKRKKQLRFLLSKCGKWGGKHERASSIRNSNISPWKYGTAPRKVCRNARNFFSNRFHFIYISLYFLPDLRKISVKFLKKAAVLSSVAIARRINVKGRKEKREKGGKGSSKEYVLRVIIKRLHFFTVFTWHRLTSSYRS